MAHQTTQLSSTQMAQQVDARGLRCPLPLLKAKQALARVSEGQCVRVLATDKGSVKDIPAFARLSGHRLLAFHEYEGEYEYLLQKSTPSPSSDL